jgi:hypothetical protein
MKRTARTVVVATRVDDGRAGGCVRAWKTAGKRTSAAREREAPTSGLGVMTSGRGGSVRNPRDRRTDWRLTQMASGADRPAGIGARISD